MTDYKHKEIVLDNKVTLKINNISEVDSWNTVAILENVVLNSKTVLEVFYTYEESLENILFQILLWKQDDTYFWSNVNFLNQNNKRGVVMIDFSVLKKVGEIKYSDVEYTEIRLKRINK